MFIKQKIFSLLTFLTIFVLIIGCKKEYNEINPTDIVYTLGANSYGVLGNGTEIDANSNPIRILGLRNIIQVCASSQVSMALSSDGKVFAWGDNENGQLGIGDTAKKCLFPRQVTGFPKIKKVATGGIISLALDINGSVWMWGTIFVNDFAEPPPLFSSSTPIKVNISNIIDIGCGYHYCVAVSASGEVFTWGYNDGGTLGDGTITSRIDPKVINGVSNVKMIAAGAYHVLALTNAGEVYSWGFNVDGQLGLNNNNSVSIPQKISGLSGVSSIAAGGFHSLCLTSDGYVWAWGSNTSGEVGNGGDVFTNIYHPVQLSSISNVTQICAAGSSSIAKTSDGKFWAWGDYNFNSMNGTGGYYGYTKNVPTEIQSLSNSKLIACGGFDYIVVKEN
jgi:alpha-tubulin suppressor-like RCC1 family protein